MSFKHLIMESRFSSRLAAYWPSLPGGDFHLPKRLYCRYSFRYYHADVDPGGFRVEGIYHIYVTHLCQKNRLQKSLRAPLLELCDHMH